MTLNASGPISLAGTTAGQSIEIELAGNGTTQISLNDTAVRTLAGVASGQITMPTDFWGKSNIPTPYYWINVYSKIYSYYCGGCPGCCIPPACVTGLTGSISGMYAQQANTFAYIANNSLTQPSTYSIVNNTGNVESYYNPSVGTTLNYSSADNMYWNTVVSGGGTIAFAFYNTTTFAVSSGFDTGIVGSGAGIGLRTFIDSSGNRYLLVTALNSQKIYKFNQSNVFQWATALTPTAIITSTPMTVSSNGTIYIAWKINSSTAGLTKLNSSGVYQWSRIIKGTSTSTRTINANQLVADSADTVYLAGNYNASSTTGTGYILRFDSSGTASYINTSYLNQYTNPNAITLDSSNNLYVAWASGNGGITTYVTKYNSSFVLQWTRSFVNGTPAGWTWVTLFIYSIQVNTAGMLVIAATNVASSSGFTQNNQIGVVYSVPTDGSKTGTYNFPIAGATTTVTYASATVGLVNSLYTTTNSVSVGATPATPTVSAYSPTPLSLTSITSIRQFTSIP